jgi:thioredoxin 1
MRNILYFLSAVVLISVSVFAKEKTVLRSPAQAPQVTFVELGSVSCVPCKMMQPIMAAIEKDYAGSVNVVFYDVWKPAGKPYAEKYGIRSIPTQVFLDAQGKEFFRHTGFYPKEEIVKVLEKQGVKKISAADNATTYQVSPGCACNTGTVCK